MREFFRGWKRKLGCVTLILACVFMVGWVRSQTTTDIVTLAYKKAIYQFGSVQGKMIWAVLQGPVDTSGLPFEQRFSWQAPHFTRAQITKANRDRVPRSVWEYLGFSFGEDQEVPTNTPIIPYWSFVLPLTLLSTYLLSSNPRARPEPPITPENERA